MSRINNGASIFSGSFIKKQLTREQVAELNKKADVTVKGNDNLASQLLVLSTFELESLTNKTAKLTQGKVEIEVKADKSLLAKVKDAVANFKNNVALAKDQIKAIKAFVAQLKKPATENDDTPALVGLSKEEHKALKYSTNIKIDQGTAENGRKYAVLTGVRQEFLEKIRKDLKSGFLGMKNPTKEKFEDKLNELNAKTNKTPADYEHIIACRYIVDNWEEFNKSGGKTKLSKSNIKQLDKVGGKDGYVTLGDLEASKDKKQGYHRKAVWGTVAAAVVGTVATVLTAGALGPVAAGSIGAAAGSVASGVIEGKKFKDIAKDAALAAALGAVGGVAAKGAGAVASKLTAKVGSQALKTAAKSAITSAARTATTTTLQDIADDGKLNNLKNIGKQTLLGAATGAASSGVSSSLGEFGTSYVGKSLERGLQQSMQTAANDLTDGNGAFDWKAVGADFVGGAVTGAVEQGLNSATAKYIGNPNDKLWVESLTGGVTGFVAGAAGELAEGAIDGSTDLLEVVTTASGNMKANAVNYDRLNKMYQQRLATGQQHWLDKAFRSAGKGISNAAAWVNKRALKPVVNGITDAGKWVGNGFKADKEVLAPAGLNYAQINAIRPQTTLNSHLPKLAVMPAIMSDEERTAAIENHTRTQYDDKNFGDAFKTAMAEAKYGNYTVGSNGKPVFTWHGKEYALEYAPIKQPTFASAAGQTKGGRTSYSFSDGNAVGIPTSMAASLQLPSIFGASELSHAGSYSSSGNYSRLQKAGMIGAGLTMTNGLIDIYNGKSQGAYQVAKGAIQLAPDVLKLGAKRVPGLATAAGAAGAAYRIQNDEYVAAGFEAASGVLTDLSGAAAASLIFAPASPFLYAGGLLIDGALVAYDWLK